MKSAIVFFVAGHLMLSGPGVAAPANAVARPLDTPRHGSTAQHRPVGFRLSQAAARISALSHVPLLISAEIGDDPVPEEIATTDAGAALKMLLADYNHLAIVDREGRYRRIWITARRDNRAQRGHVGRADESGLAATSVDDEPGRGTELPVALWQPIEDGDPLLPIDRSVPYASVLMDSSFFEDLKVGQPIEIPIPQESTPYFGVIGETHNQLNGAVRVWSGPIDGAHDTASFTLTRGRNATYATIATGTTIYEVALDNATGVGSIVNEVELTKGKDEQDALIPSEAGLSPDNN